MSRGGATPKTAPVGWVQLPDGYTIRWRRGDPVAHVLRDQQTEHHGMAGVVASIPVSPSGWTDLADSGTGGYASTATNKAHDRHR